MHAIGFNMHIGCPEYMSVIIPTLLSLFNTLSLHDEDAACRQCVMSTKNQSPHNLFGSVDLVLSVFNF